MKKTFLTGWSLAVFALITLLPLGRVHAQNFTGTGPIATNYPQTSSEQIDPLLANIETQKKKVVASGAGYLGDPSEYTLGKEDVVEIKVMRHPEVSGLYVVSSEGNIQYEFVGDIFVSGLKKDGLKDLLVKKLESFIVAPEVSVKIVEFNSKIVYVIGEVGNPGRVIMRGDTITVREALIQAGLPLLTAKGKKTMLITPSADGYPIKKKVNVDKLLYKGDLRENLVMKPGDTLYVPATFLTKTMRAISPVSQPITTAAGTGSSVSGF